MSRTLSEELVKVPGQEGDLLLPRETVVEVEWPNGNRVLGYVDKGGFREIAGADVGNVHPFPWYSGRVVRVFTEDRSERQEARARRAEAEVARLTAERDALAAQVARVEALAGQWERMATTAINPDSREWLQACAATLRECLFTEDKAAQFVPES